MDRTLAIEAGDAGSFPAEKGLSLHTPPVEGMNDGDIMDITLPTGRTDTETAIQRALNTRKGGYGRRDVLTPPDRNMMRYSFDDAIRGGTIYSRLARFADNGFVVLEWLLMVANFLTEDRVKVPSDLNIMSGLDSWDAIIAKARELVTVQHDAELAEMQGEYDADPAGFREWNTTVVGDKVTTAWAATFWWLDNVTLLSVYFVQDRVRVAVDDARDEHLTLWARGDTNCDPRKIADEAFVAGMTTLGLYICGELHSLLWGGTPMPSGWKGISLKPTTRATPACSRRGTATKGR